MFGSTWLWTTMILFLLILTPLGYGWGYRGWGAPYPRYLQRRRAQRVAAQVGSTTFDHHAWGWSADILWVTTFFWMFWIVTLTWRH